MGCNNIYWCIVNVIFRDRYYTSYISQSWIMLFCIDWNHGNINVFNMSICFVYWPINVLRFKDSISINSDSIKDGNLLSSQSAQDSMNQLIGYEFWGIFVSYLSNILLYWMYRIPAALCVNVVFWEHQLLKLLHWGNCWQRLRIWLQQRSNANEYYSMLNRHRTQFIWTTNQNHYIATSSINKEKKTISPDSHGIFQICVCNWKRINNIKQQKYWQGSYCYCWHLLSNNGWCVS